MKILSPMATGNGAYIVHQALARKIKGYQLHGYNPYSTLFPPCLPLLTHGMMADIVHTTPDYGFFFEKKNTPLVLTFHNYFLDQFMMAYSSMAQKIHYRTDLRHFTRKSLTIATVVTSVSRFTADLVRDDLGFRGEIKVIYNGVDQEMFRPEERLPRKKIRGYCSVVIRPGVRGLTLCPGLPGGLIRGLRLSDNWGVAGQETPRRLYRSAA